jgi:hypothetical protein
LPERRELIEEPGSYARTPAADGGHALILLEKLRV